MSERGRYRVFITFEAVFDAEDYEDLSQQVEDQIAVFDGPDNWTWQGWEFSDRRDGFVPNPLHPKGELST